MVFLYKNSGNLTPASSAKHLAYPLLSVGVGLLQNHTETQINMKTLTHTLAIAALSLLPILSSAQNGAQYIRITITENSNMPTQAPAVMILQFDAYGDDLLASPDQGNANSLGNINAEIFPFTISSDSTVITGVDARPELLSYRTIPFGVVCKDTGYMKIIAEVSSSDPNVPAPNFVWLEQISTGEHFSILDTVKFTLQANPNYDSDFILHIGTECGSKPEDESCYGYNNGSVHVSSPEINNFTYELSQGANIIFSGIVAGTDTTLQNLASGSYVGVIRVNGIPVDSSDITIGSPAALIADFASDFNFINQGDSVNFTDYSTGAFSYHWDFGDGNSCFTNGSTSHTFANAGLFNVALTIYDTNGCTASTFDLIDVDSVMMSAANNNFNFSSNQSFHMNTPVNEDNSLIVTQPSETHSHCFYSDERIVLVLNPAEVVRVTITSMTGALITSGAQTDNRAEYPVPANGIYVVTAEYTNGTITAATILAQ